jgi:hypothetical protein
MRDAGAHRFGDNADGKPLKPRQNIAPEIHAGQGPVIAPYEGRFTLLRGCGGPARLRQIGHPEYDYTSIRVSFLKRCRKQLGEAAAFHLSGSKEFRSFQELMRAEGDFIALPIDLDD